MTISPTAWPTFDPATVHRTVLRNGLTVLARRDSTAPVVAIVTHVKAGYFDETDDVVGIAHVLEHMYFKGTRTRGVGEIARQTKAVGGYLNASTIYDHTVYYTVLPSSGFEAGMAIQSDAFANSLIDAEELAKELEVIVQEAKRKADNPSAVTIETLFEILHDRHRIRRWRIGREPGLRALTRDHLLRFYRNFYRPSNTILSIVGDVDPADALREAERCYGALEDAAIAYSPGPAEGDTTGFRVREMTGDVRQAQLAIGWRAPGTLHEDTPALELAALVLGAGRASRLARAVRDRKLASHVSASDYTPTELGVFVLQADAPPDTALEAARAMWDQVRRVREDGIDAGELERARRVLEARWMRALESMEGQATHLAEWEALGDWRRGDVFFDQAMAVDAEAVAGAVRRWLEPDLAGWTVYRPAAAPAIAGDDPAEARSRLEREPRPAPLTQVARPAIEAPGLQRALLLEREERAVRVYRTALGIPVLVRRREGARLVHIGVYAAGGASREDDKVSGLTTIVARAATRGTTTRTAAQVAEASELLGGTIAPSVSADGFGWTLSVPARHVEEALGLLADVVQRATFDADAVETERAITLAQVAQLRDDMLRYPVRLATEAAFGAHPYARPLLGTEVTLRAIGADDVRAWHRTHVLTAPSVVAIVGDVDPDDVAAIAARAFDALVGMELEPLVPPAWPSDVRVVAEQRDKAQTALAMLFPSPARVDDARYVAELIAGVASGLGGRFFDELRDRQSLAYTVQAWSTERVQAGTFGAYIATSPDREEAAREGLLREFARLREDRVTEEELRRAQTYAIGTHAIAQQSGASVLAELVDAWMYGAGLGELEVYESRVRAVTADGMRAFARAWLDEGKRVEGIVRGTGRAV